MRKERLSSKEREFEEGENKLHRKNFSNQRNWLPLWVRQHSTQTKVILSHRLEKPYWDNFFHSFWLTSSQHSHSHKRENYVQAIKFILRVHCIETLLNIKVEGPLQLHFKNIWKGNQTILIPPTHLFFSIRTRIRVRICHLWFFFLTPAEEKNLTFHFAL